MIYKYLRQILCVALALSVIARTGALGANGKPASDTAVTSTLQDTADAADGGQPFTIESDGLGSYQNNVESVQSLLQAALGDWVLDTSSSTSRSVRIGFTQPVPGQSPGSVAPPFTNLTTVQARFISQCSLVGIDYRKIAPGDTVGCPVHIGFNYNGTAYGLAMNTQNYPATQFAAVTCTSAPGSPCSVWTIEPLSSTEGNIAELVGPAPKGHNQGPVQLGEFYMTFSITLTKS